jgi:nitric oxide reductase subunit B
VRVSFWGLNVGLASMIVFNLCPGDVMQLYDVLQNGCWHARGHEYLGLTAARFVEWARPPGDVIFIFVGVVPLLWISTSAYVSMRRTPAAALTKVSARPLLGEISAPD